MLHGVSALAVAVTSLLHLGAAILVWRPGGGSARANLPAAMLLVFTLVQMVLGMAHMKALHVPIGVLMFGASVMQLGQIWSSPRPVAAAAA
jgi:heme A synthase